jgi:sigma-E factor negative regulatory protein RseA
MKDKISMRLDGELEDRELGEALAAMSTHEEARTAWASYHLIRDALRGESGLTVNFAAGICERLALEPTVLAPRRRVPAAGPKRWFALSAAASVAAVALVGWLAFAPHQTRNGGTIAMSVALKPKTQDPAAANPKSLQRVPLPSSADDYLLAHQGYSPQLSLQGVAPYIRTVSDEAVQSGVQ